MGLDMAMVARVAEGKRARLKAAGAEWKAVNRAAGRDFGGLFDIALQQGYVGECVLRAIADGPYAGRVALKGGTLMRVWERASSRPTRDIDFQLRLGVDVAEFREWMLDAITAPIFAETYGVVADRATILAVPIKEGVLHGSLRFEGPVWIGPPGKGSRVTLTVEVTTGLLPDPEGIEVREVAPLLAKDAPIKVVCARPEYVVADKLHAIVARGKEGTRLKDWFDVLHLARATDIDPVRLREVLGHVFENEFRGYSAWPDCVEAAPGLTVAYAEGRDDGLDRYWRERRWPELAGRRWQEGRDPTLAEAAEAVGMLTEDWGLCERRSPTALASWAIRRLATAEEASAFAEALEDLVPALSGGADPVRLSARLHGDPAAALLTALRRGEAAGWLRPWMAETAQAAALALSGGGAAPLGTLSPVVG